MSIYLSKEIKDKIEQEAIKEAALSFHPIYSKDQNTACQINYRVGAEKYAELWQAAEAKAERYEKALKLIEQMSDPGDYWKAICNMKKIATEALTDKTSTDDTE